jgi:hypothetical protein
MKGIHKGTQLENEHTYDRRYDGNHDDSAERAFDLEERRYQRERHDEDAIEARAERDTQAAINLQRHIAAFFDVPRRPMPGYAQIGNGIYVRTGSKKQKGAR